MIAFVILLFLVAGFIYQSRASRNDIEKFVAPGKLVRTSQGEIHLYCQGQGEVTVILESGQGDSSLDWADVQSAVAQFTRVCTYDRPGLGWSSPATNILTAQQIADNLHQTLKGADILGPYILVGHSIGGVYVRAFARQHPEEITGLVLVDSAHENQRSRLPSDILKEDRILKWFASVFRVLAPFGIARALKLADRMQGDNYSDEIRAAAMARMYQSHFFKALFNEVKASELSTTQREPLPALGNTPLIVLSRGATNPGLPEAQFEHLKQCWSELQRDLVHLSTNSQHIIADKSGHYIQRDQPELVVNAIRRIVNGSQSQRSTIK